MHHDISSGNIMLHGDTVKIADLEYAQKLNKTGAGEKSTVSYAPLHFDFISNAW